MADEFTKAALYGIKTFNKKVKEKIGMEKLIELLNEFLEENYPKKNLVKAIEDDYFVNNWNDGDGFLCETIMSKKFGFIKWLVENDKIDIEKVYENLTNYEIEIRIRAVKELLENNEEDTIAYLKLLMLLAIQDEPIRFLCEILK